MQRPIFASVFAVGLAMSASAGFADCAEDLERLTAGVSKDGTMAPLQEPSDSTPQTGAATPGVTETAEGDVAKTGESAPLGTDTSQAMSGEDAQAQSAGGATAAEQAAGAAPGDAKADAIARAQAALDAGDEAACLEALDSAKG